MKQQQAKKGKTCMIPNYFQNTAHIIFTQLCSKMLHNQVVLFVNIYLNSKGLFFSSAHDLTVQKQKMRIFRRVRKVVMKGGSAPICTIPFVVAEQLGTQ